MTTALAKPEDAFFTDDQLKIIRDSFLNGASPAEAAMLLEVAKSLRLNPLKKQIHFVKRSTKDYQTNNYRDVWAFQVAIDGFRSIAERTGRYDGQDEPEFEEGPNGPKTCTVRVYKKGISRPFTVKVWWEEYVQTNRDGKPNAMWSRGRHFMLAKCAEAAALRKAFPDHLSDVYTPEELAADEQSERDVTPVRLPEAKPRPALTPGEQALRAKQATLDALRDWVTKANPAHPKLGEARAKVEALEREVAAPPASPAPKMQIVDVQPGETEEQATARSAEWAPMSKEEEASILQQESGGAG